VALDGSTVAVSEEEEPFVIAIVDLSSSTPVTLTVVAGVLTVTLHVAVLLPSSVVTVMVALPAETALTTPLDTVATDVLLDFHVTFLLVASDGEMVGVSLVSEPVSKAIEVLSSDTPVTLTSFPLLEVKTTAAAIAAKATIRIATIAIILFFSI
jgi:hypothetical protein